MSKRSKKTQQNRKGLEEAGNQKEGTHEPYRQFEDSRNKDTPLLASSMKEKVFHSYLDKVLEQGLKEPFGFNHLFGIPEELTYKAIAEKLEDTMTPQTRREILSCPNSDKFFEYYHEFLGPDRKIGIFFSILAQNLQILIPLFIKYLIQWVEEFDSANANQFSQGLLKDESLAEGSQGVPQLKVKGLLVALGFTLALILSKAVFYLSKYYCVKSQVYVQAFVPVSFKNLKFYPNLFNFLLM